MTIKNLELFSEKSASLAKGIVSYVKEESGSTWLAKVDRFGVTVEEVMEQIEKEIFSNMHQAYRNTINNVILQNPDIESIRVHEIGKRIALDQIADTNYLYSEGYVSSVERVKNAVMEIVKNKQQHKAHEAQLESLVNPPKLHKVKGEK